MTSVVNGVETLPKMSIARTLQTDDRRQTDGRTTTYSEREREFTFAKNWQQLFYFDPVLSYKTIYITEIVKNCTFTFKTIAGTFTSKGLSVL